MNQRIHCSLFFGLVCLALAGCSTPRLEPHEGYVAVPGGRVWYQIVGSGPGVPLLLLHGGPGASSRYLKPLSVLGNDRPVIFYDQLGCGRSDRPSNTNLWRVERFVEELKAVRQALGLRRLHIFGHSWGAMLAAEYTFARPHGVESLVLASGAFNMERAIRDVNRAVAGLPPDVREKLLRNIANHTTDSAEYKEAEAIYWRRHMLRTEPPPPDLPDMDKDFGHEVHRTMYGDSLLTVTGVLKDYDSTPRLRELRLPVLFTAGQYDDSTPAENVWYQSLVPGARLEIFENAGHLTTLDSPQRSAEVVRAFLQEVERGTRKYE